MARPIQLNATKAIELRGGVYWLSQQVPKQLREAVGKARWRHTLDTRDRTVALARAQVFLDQVRNAMREEVDPSSTYFLELERLRRLGAEDASHHMDTLYPEIDERDAPSFYAARLVSQGVPPPAALFTFQSVAEDYLKTAKESIAAPTRLAVKLLGPDTPITGITRRTVGDWLEVRKREVSVATLRLNLSYMQQVYRHAMRLDLVPFSRDTPFSSWNLRSEEKKRTEPMPNTLYRALYDDLGDNRWPLVVSRLSGMRPSEAASVRLESRDGYPVWIPQHSKTTAGRFRIVPVHSSLHEIAEDIVPYLTPKHQDRAGRRLSNLKGMKREPFCNYGRGVNTYSCRVSAITDMAGIDEEIRRALVGHRSVHAGYVDEYPIGRLVEAIEQINDPLGRPYALT